MLPSNFDALASQAPDLEQALRSVSAWIQSHEDWQVLDPRILAQQLLEVDSFQLAKALSLLVRTGFYRPGYMVITPSGVLADGVFGNPEEIPPHMEDRFHIPFETFQADIVQVLEPVAARR